MLNVLKYVLGYLPWIAFAAVGTAGDDRWGALAGLGIAILLVIWARSGQKSLWDALWIETSSAIFLV